MAVSKLETMVKQGKFWKIKTDSAQFVAQAPRGLSPRRGASTPRGLSLMRRGAGVCGRHVAASRIKACAAGLKGHGPRGLYSEGEFWVLRLGNRVLMSGIIMATLISVERNPRHLFMDLNPIRPVLTCLVILCD